MSLKSLFAAGFIIISTLSLVECAGLILSDHQEITSLPKRRAINEQSASIDELKIFVESLNYAGKMPVAVPVEPRTRSFRKPRTLECHYSENYDGFSEEQLADFVNDIPISDVESDEEHPRPQGDLIIIDKVDDNIVESTTFKLQEKMFESAITPNKINYERANELLTKKKHLLLPKRTLSKILITVIKHLHQDYVNVKIFDLIARLLEEQFYQNDNLGPYFKYVFYKEKAIEAFLKHDIDFFAKYKYDPLGISFIDFEEYDLIEIVIYLRYDPRLSYGGLNMLDSVILSGIKCRLLLKGLVEKVYVSKEVDTKYCLLVEDERRIAIHNLNQLRGLSESMNLENFIKSCEVLQLFAKKAIKALNSGGIWANSKMEYLPNDKEISPISVAIQTKNVAIIKVSFDYFFNQLSLTHLYHIKTKLSTMMEFPAEAYVEFNAIVNVYYEKVSKRLQELIDTD